MVVEAASTGTFCRAMWRFGDRMNFTLHQGKGGFGSDGLSRLVLGHSAVCSHGSSLHGSLQRSAPEKPEDWKGRLKVLELTGTVGVSFSATPSLGCPVEK